METPIIRQIRVQNMTGRVGDPVRNQFIIHTPEGTYFQSYRTIIAFEANNGQIYLDRSSWDCSVTTGKYRNMFLRETKRETERNIEAGIYILADLNG